MSYSNILISGANRGIGLEFAKQYAKKATTNLLFLTCRDISKAADLKQLADGNEKIKIVELDVKDHSKFDKVLKTVQDAVGAQGLNLLVNNAGININASYQEATKDAMMEVYEVNVVSPFIFTRALHPVLEASAKAGHKTFVANISSLMGSIADNSTGHSYAYRTSKAALNQVSKSLSVQLKDHNIIVAAIHPGWVKTDMGGPKAPLDAQSSVSQMIKTFDEISPDQSGLLVNYDGKILPY